MVRRSTLEKGYGEDKKRTRSEEIKIWKLSKMEQNPIKKEKAPMSVVLQEKCSDKEESLSSLSKVGKKEKLGGWVRYDGVDGIH